MNAHRILLAIALLIFCTAAGADDLVWNGRADVNYWYWFNAEPTPPGEPWPVTWANNWGETILQPFGGNPPTFGSWDWPEGVDTVTIDMDGAELHNAIGAAVASANVGLGGRLTLFSDLQCTTLNTAGIVEVGHDAVIYQCAIQNNGGTGVLRTVDPWNNTLADAVLHDVIISVPVEIPSGMELALLGDIHLNDVISVLGDPDSAQLRIDGDVTLTGNGWIQTADTAAARITANGYYGQVFTNQSSIYAAGELGYGLLSITNEGLIVADRTTMLIVDPEDQTGDGHPGFINTGTLRAADGGTLRLNQGSYENAGGVIEAQNASVVELHHYATVTGGVLQTSGTGEIRATGVDPVVRDLTLAAGSALVIPNGGLLELDGSVTIDGELRLQSSGGAAVLIVRSPVSLDGAGEVVLTDATGNRFSFNGVEANYRLTTSIPIRGATGSVYGLAHGIAITNHSTITADGVNPVLINPSNTPIDGQAGVINTGTLRAVSGATLELEDGSFDNTGGVIEAQDGSIVELQASAAVSGGELRSTGSGVLRSTHGSLPPTLSDLTVSGRVEALGGASLRLGGTLVNDGVIETSGEIRPSGALVFEGSGELLLVNGCQIRPDATGVTNGADHTIRASGAPTNIILRELAHQGTLVVESGAGLQFQAACNAQSGSTTRVEGTLQPSGVLMMSGELTGAGTVNGVVNIGATGVLSPGTSTGTLTTGNMTVGDGASYLWQTSTATGSDLVDVNGALDLGTATLTVTIDVLDGDVPDRVVLFEYNTLASTPEVSQFELTGGYTFLGVDTSANELALTGVRYVEGLIFADSFETGDVDRWSLSRGSTLKQLPFDPTTDELNLRLWSPDWLVERGERFRLADGRDADGEPVVAVESRAGALRVGVRCARGWNWSGWRSAAGSELELHWQGRQVRLYDGEGLIGSAQAVDDVAPLALLRAHSVWEVEVDPTPVEVR